MIACPSRLGTVEHAEPTFRLSRLILGIGRLQLSAADSFAGVGTLSAEGVTAQQRRPHEPPPMKVEPANEYSPGIVPPAWQDLGCGRMRTNPIRHSLFPICRLLAGSWLGLLVLAHAGDLDVRFEGSWPGYRRGAPSAVTITRGYAWVANGGEVHVLDLADPKSPRFAGGIHRTDGQNIASLTLEGRYLYLACNDFGIEVLDASDPARLRWMGQYRTNGIAFQHVAISGNQAFVAAHDAGLQVFDLIDSTSPRKVGQYSVPFGFGRMTHSHRVTVSGQYAYVANVVQVQGDLPWHGELWVLDVSVPSRPRRVGQYSSPFAWSTPLTTVDLQVDGDVAYFATGHLEVLNLGDPVHPKRVGALLNPASPIQAIGVSGNYLCVTEGDAGLEVVDVSDPTLPAVVGRLTNISAGAVALSGYFAYVAGGTGADSPDVPAALNVVDLTNPVRPMLVGRHGAGKAQALALQGASALVADGTGGLSRVDLSRPHHPEWMATVDLGAECRGVAAVGDVVAVAAGAKGLQMVELVGPRGLRRVSGWDTGGDAWNVAAWQGQWVYVSDASGGLHVFDCSDPYAPRLLGRHAELTAQRVAISGSCAFVPKGRWVPVLFDPIRQRWVADELVILALDEGVPLGQVVGRWKTPEMPLIDSSHISDVAVTGHHAYLAMPGGVVVLDIADPSGPVALGTYVTSVSPEAVAVSGDLLAVGGDWWDGSSVQATRGWLHLLDISNPAAPRRSGGTALRDGVAGLVLAANRVFVANGQSGITVFDCSADANPQRVGRLAAGQAITGFALSDSVACVSTQDIVTSENALHLFDSSGVGQLRPVGWVTIPDAWPGRVAVAMGRAYCVAANGTLTIIDIRDAAAPRRIGVVTNVPSESLVVSGNLMWVTTREVLPGPGSTPRPVAMRAYDVSGASPSFLGEYRSGLRGQGQLTRLAVNGSHGLLALGHDLQLVDLADPSQPRLAGARRFQGDVNAVALAGGYACARERLKGDYWNPGVDRIHVLDLADPSDLRTMGETEIRSEVGAVLVADGLVGVLPGGGWETYGLGAEVYGDGVQLIDVSDPTRPHRVGGNSAVAGRLLAASGRRVLLGGVASDGGAFGQALDLLAWYPAVRFADHPTSATEGDTNGISVAVERVGDVSAPFTVEIQTADRTASAGEDYVAQRQTLTFAAGQRRQEVRIPVLDDGTYEGTESFSVLLLNPSGERVLGSPFRVSGEIVDDEPVPSPGCGDAPCLGTERVLRASVGAWGLTVGPGGEVFSVAYEELRALNPVNGHSRVVWTGLNRALAVEAFGPDLYFTEAGTEGGRFQNGSLSVYHTLTGRRDVLARGLHYPKSLCVDAGGYVYVLEAGGSYAPFGGRDRLIQFAPGSSAVEVILSETPALASAVVLTSDGSIVLGVGRPHFQSPGRLLRYHPGVSEPETLLTIPEQIVDLAIDRDDNLYLALSGPGGPAGPPVGIGMLARGGSHLVHFRTGIRAGCLAIDEAGNIYYGSAGDGGELRVLTPFPPRARVAAVAWRPGGGLELTLEGATGKTLHLEASTDLRLWRPVFTFVSTQPRVQLTDPEVTRFPRRFYRLRDGE